MERIDLVVLVTEMGGYSSKYFAVEVFRFALGSAEPCCRKAEGWKSVAVPQHHKATNLGQ